MEKYNEILIGVGIIFSMFIVSIFSIVFMFISANNYGAKQEALLQATYDNSKNILTQYNKKIMEVAQVPTMYAEDMNKLTQNAISGRYGKEGSKALFQFIQEQNPTLDSSLYKQIQQVIESGRNSFENSQTKLLDVKRVYVSSLNTIPKGFFMKLSGYPKLDLSKFEVISSTDVNTIFENKKDDSKIKLR